MAISQLVKPETAGKTTRSEFSATKNEKPKTENLTKTSNMFGDNFVAGAITSLNELNSQLNKLHDSSKKLVMTANKLLRDIKNLHKDIVSKFRAFSSDLSASRVDVSRAAFTEIPTPDMSAMDLGAPVPVASTTTPAAGTPTNTPGPLDITKTVTDIVTSMLGGAKAVSALGGFISSMGASALGSLATFFASTLGGTFLAAAGGSMLALAAAIFGSAGIADKLYSYFGLDKKLKELYESEKYKQEIVKPGEQAAAAMAAKSGPQREQRQNSITEFLQSKGLGPAPKGSEIEQPGGKGSDLIRIIKKGHPDEGKTFNFKTGEEVSGAAPAGGAAPTTPAAPSASGAPAASPTASSTPSTPSASGAPAARPAEKPVTPPQPPSTSEGTSPGIDPEIAKKAAEYKEMGRKGIALPPEVGANPLTGKLAITAWEEGQKEAAGQSAGSPSRTSSSAPPRNLRGVKLYGEQGDGAVGDQLRPGAGQRESQTAEALTYNPMTGEKLKGEGLAGVRSRAMGGRQASAGTEDKAGMERISIGADGTDYSAYNQTKWIEKDIMGQKTMVPIYYNPITNKQYSPESAQKSAERMRPEMIRGRMEQFDRQQEVNSMKSAEEMRMRNNVRPLEPVVINDSSTVNTGSSSGGETNNVSGQNFPMSAVNNNLQPYLAKQNLEYQ